MRFGKKLALQVTGDESGAPYISHKPMKEAINKTVRELRVYQSKGQMPQGLQEQQELQDQSYSSQGRPRAGEGEAAATSEELAELETCITSLDRQLFDLVDQDLLRILEHIRLSEESLESRIGEIQERAMECGLVVEEAKLEELEKVLPFAPLQRTNLCQRLLEFRIQCKPVEMSDQLEAIFEMYRTLAESMNQHSQYLEINVAGFRKLLKRHEKQIPRKFHARDTPYLGFHRLVTRTTRQLLEIVKQFGALLQDAQGTLVDVVSQQDRVAAATAGAPQAQAAPAEVVQKWRSQEVALAEVKALGPECEMVLEIQKQLKAKSHIGPLATQFDTSLPGVLYPKPAATCASRGPVQDLQARLSQGDSDEPPTGSRPPRPNFRNRH